MTTLIAYHTLTKDLALFETNGAYWIGSYSPYMTHCSDEPSYIWIRAGGDTMEEGLVVLTQLDGTEF